MDDTKKKTILEFVKQYIFPTRYDETSEFEQDPSKKKRLRRSGSQIKERKKTFSMVTKYEELKQENEELKKKNDELIQLNLKLSEDIDQLRDDLQVFITEQRCHATIEKTCKELAKTLIRYIKIPFKVFGLLSAETESQYSKEFIDKIYDEFIAETSGFYPFLVKTNENGDFVYTLNEDDETYKKMKQLYPENLYRDIIRATEERIEYGHIGSFWNEEKQREMDIGDIMKCICTFFENVEEIPAEILITEIQEGNSEETAKEIPKEGEETGTNSLIEEIPIEEPLTPTIVSNIDSGPSSTE